jgi:hypothetical protein
MDPRPNKKGGFRRYQSDLGKEKFHKRGLLGLKEKRQKKKKNQKVPKRNFGSKREKEKEKKTKKRSIEPAIGVPRCAHRVPTTDRAGPGRTGQGTGPVPTWGYPFFSVSRLSLLSARWCCCIIRADESGRMIYIKTEGKEKRKRRA